MGFAPGGGDQGRDRDGEAGAALIVSLITLVALLSIGTLTLLSVRSEVSSSGQGRFQQVALYTAESGFAVGMEYLRDHCDVTGLFFTELVTPDNTSPLSPVEIMGNGVQPGQTGNPFAPEARTWYEVTILNNESDSGLGAGEDKDGIVVLRVVGHAPNQTQATIEVTVLASSCVATYCDYGYSQEGQNEANNANAVCGKQIDSGGVGARTLTPG